MEFLTLLEWYRDKIMIGFGNTKVLGLLMMLTEHHESSHIALANWNSKARHGFNR